MMSTAFHPNKSHVSASALSEFLNAELQMEITSVPGIGPATAELLRQTRVRMVSSSGAEVLLEPITSAHGLIGVFLAFKSGPVDPATGRVRHLPPVEHMERFYRWYCSVVTGATKFRAGTCNAIAEKANIAFPGIYDSSVYYDGEM
jgi:hypothetical protein